MKKEKFLEVFGWYGTVAIFGAYGLNSFGFIAANTLTYQLLNLTGAIGIVLISLYKKAYQPGVLNIIWSIIAIVALVRIIL